MELWKKILIYIFSSSFLFIFSSSIFSLFFLVFLSFS